MCCPWDPAAKHLAAFEDFLGTIDNALHVCGAFLDDLLHLRARLLQIVRPGAFIQLHGAMLLVLSPPCVSHARVGLFAGFRRLGHGGSS